MRLFKCVNLVATGVCVHVRSFEMLVCVCVVRCVAVGACIHARACVARTMRRSLAVVYVLAFLPCVASTDDHLPRIATHVAASSFKLEEHELYRKCEEPIHSRSATPSLPTRDCRMRPDLLVPSRTSSSKVYLALSFLTRTSNLYLHGVRTCAGCGGAYPSESRLVMGEELTAASLLHRFAYQTDASGMQRPCCAVAAPSHMPCNGRMRVYRQKTSPPCRRELL